MELLHEIVVSALIVGGTAFSLVGAWGMIRLPELMSRLHAPTKAATLGLGGVLLASMAHFFFSAQGLSTHELLITLFIFLTAPITALFLAKAYLHRNVDPRRGLPGAGEHGWSTFDRIDGDRAKGPMRR